MSKTIWRKTEIEATEGPNRRFLVDVSKEYYTPDRLFRFGK